jgi:hypothetical protein
MPEEVIQMVDQAVRIFEWITGLPEPWNWVIGLAVVLGLTGLTFYRMFKFVKRDTIAIRERVGKPILRYGPRFGKSKLSKDERRRRMKIDKRLIELQENPIYGKEVTHEAGPVILNPITHTIELVENRERPIKITDFPIMIDRGNYRGFKISLTVTVKMKSAYRWRYRSMEVDEQVKAILTDRLHKVCNDIGPLEVRDNVDAALRKYVSVLQTEVRQHVEYDTLDDELATLLKDFLDKDPIQGVLAKYGGFASAVCLEKLEDIYEGWQPQATLKVADAIHGKAGALFNPQRASESFFTGFKP